MVLCVTRDKNLLYSRRLWMVMTDDGRTYPKETTQQHTTSTHRSNAPPAFL